MRGLILLLCLWQVAVWTSGLPAFVLPPPAEVARTLWTARGLLAPHLLWTLAEVLAGMALGTALGAGLAVGLQLVPRLRGFLEPLLTASQAVPVFVLAPLLVVLFGYGIGPKVAMSVMLVFFPVFGGFSAAMDGLPEGQADLARIARAGRWREVIHLRVPHGLPGLVAGLAIGASYAPTGAVIGEWVGASQGLGYLMLMANARSQTALMFASLVLVVAMTLALRALALRLGAAVSDRDAPSPKRKAPRRFGPEKRRPRGLPDAAPADSLTPRP